MNELTKDLRRENVRVHDYPDGTIAIKYQGADLPHLPSGGPRRVPA